MRRRQARGRRGVPTPLICMRVGLKMPPTALAFAALAAHVTTRLLRALGPAPAQGRPGLCRFMRFMISDPCHLSTACRRRAPGLVWVTPLIRGLCRPDSSGMGNGEG